MGRKVKVFELGYELIIQLFEKHGIILFRDFDLDGKDIKKFSDLFTINYSQDAQKGIVDLVIEILEM